MYIYNCGIKNFRHARRYSSFYRLRVIKISPELKKGIHRKIHNARNCDNKAASLGQWIGKILSSGVTLIWKEILLKNRDFKLMLPETGKSSNRLLNKMGQLKQIDDIVCNYKNEPVVICESKWLKDSRHLNDKGSWIAMMGEVRHITPTVKGAISVLAGPWESGGNAYALSRVVEVIHIKKDEVYELLHSFDVSIEINKKKDTYIKPERSLESLLKKVVMYSKYDIDFVSTLGYELVSRYRTDIQRAFKRIIRIPESSDFVKSSEIEKVVVSYITKDGLEYKMFFENTSDAIDKLNDSV